MHIASRRTVNTLRADIDGPYNACCFSEDGKYLFACSSEPDHIVVVWHWVDERPVGLMRPRTAIGRIRFNPGVLCWLTRFCPELHRIVSWTARTPIVRIFRKMVDSASLQERLAFYRHHIHSRCRV